LVEDFELEEVDRDELGAPSLEGIEPRNVYFDITPARLVDAWIDETGVRRAWES
jgi:translation initiation factor eIF-2B subunit delta